MNSATLHDKLKTKSIRSTFFAIVQTLSLAAYTQKVAFVAATSVMVQVTSFFILRPLHGQNAGTHSCTLVALSSVWYTNQPLRTRHNSRPKTKTASERYSATLWFNAASKAFWNMGRADCARCPPSANSEPCSSTKTHRSVSH